MPHSSKAAAMRACYDLAAGVHRGGAACQLVRARSPCSAHRPLPRPPAAPCLCCRCSRAPTRLRTSWCSASCRWCSSPRSRSSSGEPPSGRCCPGCRSKSPSSCGLVESWVEGRHAGPLQAATRRSRASPSSARVRLCRNRARCRRGPMAQPHLVLTHYTELMGDKGVVLVRGDIVHPNACSRGEVRSRGCGMTPLLP